MNDDSKEKSAMRLQLEAMSKKRVRLNQWQKDYAAVMGWPLRGKGRPRKATPTQPRAS